MILVLGRASAHVRTALSAWRSGACLAFLQDADRVWLLSGTVMLHNQELISMSSRVDLLFLYVSECMVFDGGIPLFLRFW